MSYYPLIPKACSVKAEDGSTRVNMAGAGHARFTPLCLAARCFVTTEDRCPERGAQAARRAHIGAMMCYALFYAKSA